MTTKNKFFMVALALWFWAFSHVPELTKDWPAYKVVGIMMLAAAVMFWITWLFFSEDVKHNPKDFIWYNYHRPLDPFH